MIRGPTAPSLIDRNPKPLLRKSSTNVIKGRSDRSNRQAIRISPGCRDFRHLFILGRSVFAPEILSIKIEFASRGILVDRVGLVFGF